VPNFFWDSEPTLHPLYAAVREYLEIDPRIKVLNERCRVFLDLAEILSDSIADSKMSYITWIIIVLIIVSICVTVTEVALRFAMLERNKSDNKMIKPALANINWDPASVAMAETSLSPSSQPVAEMVLATSRENTAAPRSDLEIMAETLGLQLNASLDDVRQGIWDLRQRSLACATPLGQESHGSYNV
jgi:hypothetical protein